MKLYDVLRKEQSEELIQREQASDHSHVEIPHTARFVLTKKKLFVMGGVLALITTMYVLGVQLVHARISITERRIPFTLTSAELELTNQEKADSGRLSFQAMVVDTTITRQVYGSALTNSNTKAKGSVVFFNEYSSAKQTVKKGTTLTAPGGKKYITQAQVVVPGYTMVNKKKIAGTSPSVDIVAVEVGESYNNPGATLSVAGWSNASKTFYARSTAITGGEAGVSHTLTETEREQTIATLQTQLVERLKRETRTQIPEDFVTFPELQLPIIDADSFVFKGGSVSFPASMSGVMVSYLIPRNLLEQAIAAKALSDRSYAAVAIPGLDDLSFDLQTIIPTDPTVIPDAITITVSGQGTIITKVPIDKVKERLLGVPRRMFSEVLADVPEIDTATFRFIPFWSPRFPSKWNDITIITK